MSNRIMNQALLAFIAGVTNGGVSCSTVQGGLLATAVTKSESKFKSTFLFLTSKIIVHTLVGFLLGYIGSSLTFSLKVQGNLQIFVGLFMIFTAFRVLGVRSLFDFTEIPTPKGVVEFFNNIYHKYPNLKPIILGLTTIFIPCGSTQAMFVLAVGSGNPINGALIMFSFVLGTSPLFFILGITVGNMFKYNILAKVAGITLIVLGILSINNGQVLKGSVHTLQNYAWALTNNSDISNNLALNINGIQQVEMTATNTGYSTNTKKLKLGVPVRLTITTKGVVSCVSNFVIPSLNINVSLPSNGQKVIEFIPNKEGLLTYSCGMGMYTGSFEIVK